MDEHQAPTLLEVSERQTDKRWRHEVFRKCQKVYLRGLRPYKASRHRKGCGEFAMKYTGPPKPIPTHIEVVSDKVERICFLLLAAFLAVYFYLEK